jgi:hypothetical protein
MIFDKGIGTMIRRVFLGLALSLGSMMPVTSTNLLAFETTADSVTTPTHKQFKLFRPTHASLQVALQTFCLDSQGNIVAAVSTSGALVNNESVSGMVLYYSPEFELTKEVALDFAPTALNFDSDGTLYVAGNGKLAKIDADGKIIQKSATPNLLDADNLRDKAKAKLEAEREQMSASYKSQIDMIDKAIAIKKKADKKDDPAEEEKKTEEPKEASSETEAEGEVDESYVEQLTQVSMEELENMRKSYDDYLKQFKVGQPIQDEEVESAIAGMGQVRSLAIGDEDVFVTCPANMGYGYDIWRVNKDLTDAKVVVKGVSGCCGQMDIQAKGKQLYVAENTKFRVGVYNQNGKLTAKFGSQDRTGKTGFGSCCNPMNIRCCDNGDVLTAESSIGTIKRFDASGNLVATIGKAKIGGGCKHVALAHDAKLDRYYMMYEDEAAVCVLVNQTQFTGETEDEKLAREAAEGLGKKIMGGWELVAAKEDNKDEAKSGEEKAAGDVTVFSVGSGQALTMVDLYGFKKINFKSENKVDVVSSGQFAIFGEGTEWIPVQQAGSKLTISLLNDQVETLKIVADFVSDNEVKFGLEFGRGTPTQPLGSFKRIKE